MAKLVDPDINMICLDGHSSPEPSVRHMIEQYYQRAFSPSHSRRLAAELIDKHTNICELSITARGQ